MGGGWILCYEGLKSSMSNVCVTQIEFDIEKILIACQGTYVHSASEVDFLHHLAILYG